MTNYKTIFLAGFISFIILNFIENVLHYSIGRSHQKNYNIVIPSKNDSIKIILIMILFAFLQGILTSIIDFYEN